MKPDNDNPVIQRRIVPKGYLSRIVRREDTEYLTIYEVAVYKMESSRYIKIGEFTFPWYNDSEDFFENLKSEIEFRITSRSRARK